MTMRYLCLYRPGTATENDNPPTQDEIQRMGKLIQEMSQAGVLLATEGCRSSDHGARVHVSSGDYRVTDGPFPETKELIAGMCLLQVKSKAEAIEWGKRFLAVVGHGETEIRLLCEAPAA
jgi:hypothetical protein